MYINSSLKKCVRLLTYTTAGAMTIGFEQWCVSLMKSIQAVINAQWHTCTVRTVDTVRFVFKWCITNTSQIKL